MRKVKALSSTKFGPMLTNLPGRGISKRKSNGKLLYQGIRLHNLADDREQQQGDAEEPTGEQEAYKVYAGDDDGEIPF